MEERAVRDFDITIVGYGPVGQTAAAILGRLGYRVAVVERWDAIYTLSRAAHVDHEIMRIFQSLGLADEMAKRMKSGRGSVNFDAEGNVLQRVEVTLHGQSGWEADYFIYQPYVEESIDRLVRSLPTVEVFFGMEACGLQQDAEGVELTMRPRSGGPEQVIRSQYLIGSDGANSFVREALGVTDTDLGFEADWLVVDVRPHDPDMAIFDQKWGITMTGNGQILDPERPSVFIRWLGVEHVRWEFKLIGEETREAVNSPDACWRLLSRWGVSPENVELTKHTVYTFRSLVADQFVVGRVALVGDSAHRQPPFLGQGLCAGIRDAYGLAWRLDLLLRGHRPSTLLASYASERRGADLTMVQMSVQRGELVSVTDRAEAAARDAAYRAGKIAPMKPLPPLRDGLQYRNHDSSVPTNAGILSVQGVVRVGDKSGRFDDIVGRGWVVLSRREDVAPSLRPSQLDVLSTLRAVVTRLGTQEGAFEDIEGTYEQWFATLGCNFVIIRPDFYVFGTADDVVELRAMIDDLGRQLFAGTPIPTPAIA